VNLLREYIRRLLIEQPVVDIWYHGSDEPISGALKSLYLTDDEALANIGGRSHVYKFQISPSANWLDLSDIQMGPLALVSMDSLGYNPHQIERIREEGYDVVWQSDEFSLYRQIFVVSPNVIRSLS
tara:strand:+ start:837 stop:1214 length:378 start_codon:yes stop_codon:yes gene_type:complete